MTDELKPCPFCGGEAGVVRAEKAVDGQRVPKGSVAYRAYCKECQVRQHGFHHRSETESVAAWNTRPQADTALVELRRELADLDNLMANQIELNPSNYDHDQVCELNSQAVEIYDIARVLFPRILSALSAQDKALREAVDHLTLTLHVCDEAYRKYEVDFDASDTQRLQSARAVEQKFRQALARIDQAGEAK